MKRILVILALLAPAFGLVFFALQPRADVTVSVPIFHFYIVTFTTFSAAVISILLAASLGAEAKPRHVLAAGAFAVIGSVFFSHGLATPNALIDHFHPAVEWSAWLTLFGSGALFAAAALDGPQGPPRWLPVRRVIYAAVIGVLVYSALAAFAPEGLSAVDDLFASLAAPWHRYAIFALTLALWLLAAFGLWRTWRATGSRIDGVLTFMAFWLATATVSMHSFEIWKLSWWLYHVVLLVSFVITVFVLTAEYEQIRQFRLIRYYLAASLILTALLALAASALFTQFAYDTLVAETMTSSAGITDNLANTLVDDLPDLTTPAKVSSLNERPGIRALVGVRISGLSINSVAVYDVGGVAAYDSEPEWVGTPVENRAAFEQALGGQTTVVIRQPGDAPATYHPATRVHIVEAYAPIHPGGNPNSPPIGVLGTIQEAPALNQAAISARIRGLVTAAVTMGLLFVALLSVVGRADRIITERTDALRKVTARLKTYSEWLLGRDLLGRILDDPNALSLIRRERTVLFMDIRGFTRWSEACAPEEVVAMLNRYYDTVASTVSRRGVIKFKFSADEAMVVFPDAERAVTAALELRARMAELLSAYDLGAGMGLHTGPLVEGLLGSTDVKFYDVIGDTVNTAKRIESAAAKVEALISEATRQALDDKFPVGEARYITAKGKEAPVTVYPLA